MTRTSIFTNINFFAPLSFGAVCCATPLLAQQSSRKADQMNILMIAIDDMNIWPGAFDGVAKTPNIDKLASKSVQFTNAHCVVPASNPSRTALFTGLRPETTGQYTNQGNFRDKKNNIELVTLPQYLQKFGYQTVSSGKVFHHPRGKESEPNPYSDPQSWNTQKIGAVGVGGHKDYLNERDLAKWHNGEMDGYLGKFGVWGPIPYEKEVTEEWKNARYCADFLEQEHSGPFFLACGVFAPHAPHIAPKEFFDLYPTESIELPECPENDMNDIPKIAQTNFSTPFFDLVKRKDQWKTAVQGYLACMSFADAVLGEVLNALENSKYRDNTIVILFTDNGFQLGHKNRWEKYSLWRMATNTPLVIKTPNGAQGECKRAVSYLDIYPTLLDLLKIEQPDFLQGTSFANLVGNPQGQRDVPAVVTHEKGNTSVVLDQWNLITYRDGSQELYNRENDKLEFNNLIADQKYEDIVARLSKYIPTEN